MRDEIVIRAAAACEGPLIALLVGAQHNRRRAQGSPALQVADLRRH